MDSKTQKLPVSEVAEIYKFFYKKGRKYFDTGPVGSGDAANQGRAIN